MNHNHANPSPELRPPLPDRISDSSGESTPERREVHGDCLLDGYVGPAILCGLVNPLAPLTFNRIPILWVREMDAPR